jgi:hypothetical protein
VATPTDGATPLLFYVNCAACEATLVTPTPTTTSTPTPSVTNTQTPSVTPTLTPTPSTSPVPVTGYSFNLVALPYNFPSSGNTIMNGAGGAISGTTDPNVLATGSRGIYWNSIDSDGIDRTDYFSGFTGQSITITMSQTGSTAIYSGDTNSLKTWTSSPDNGFVFGAGIGVPPPPSTPSGTAVLIQSASTQWTLGLPVYISAEINVGVTPTPTETSTNTPTPSVTNTQTPTGTPAETATETQTPTPTPTGTPAETPGSTPGETPTPTPTGTPAETPTPTTTTTLTATETQTPTPTPTGTPAETPGSTPGETPTPTTTTTLTATETQTPTPTPTTTTTLTATETQTPTPTAEPTSTPTPTQTQTPTGTPISTGTPTQTPTTSFITSISYSIGYNTNNGGGSYGGYSTPLDSCVSGIPNIVGVYSVNALGNGTVLYLDAARTQPFISSGGYFIATGGIGIQYYFTYTSSSSDITNCDTLPSQTPTNTPTQTQTPTNTPTTTTTLTSTPTPSTTTTLTATPTPTQPLTDVTINIGTQNSADGSGEITVYAYTSGNTNVDTNVVVGFKWVGDLSSEITGTVTITNGTSCNNNTFAGATAGENISTFEITSITPISSGTQSYSEGSANYPINACP